jgi:hypothetical protein
MGARDAGARRCWRPSSRWQRRSGSGCGCSRARPQHGIHLGAAQPQLASNSAWVPALAEQILDDGAHVFSFGSDDRLGFGRLRPAAGLGRIVEPCVSLLNSLRAGGLGNLVSYTHAGSNRPVRSVRCAIGPIGAIGTGIWCRNEVMEALEPRAHESNSLSRGLIAQSLRWRPAEPPARVGTARAQPASPTSDKAPS